MTDEQIFYESEILDDDIDAPVGTLVNFNGKNDNLFLETVDEYDLPETDEPKQTEDIDETFDYVDVDETKEASTTQTEDINGASEHIDESETIEASATQTEDIDGASEPIEDDTSKTVEEADEATPDVEKKTAKPKSKLTIQSDGEDMSAHIISDIGLSNMSNSVQNILGSSDFTIKDYKPRQKTSSTAKKHKDTWAVAKLDGKNVSGQAQSPAPKPKKQKAKPAATDIENSAEQYVRPTDDIEADATAYDIVRTANIAIEPKISPDDEHISTQTVKSTDGDGLYKKKSKSKNKNSMEAINMAKEKETVKAKAESGETVIVEGTQGVPHGKFVIKRTDNDNFVFKLFSSNRRVVAVAAGQYSSLGACKIGIQSVINNAATAPIEDQTLKNVVEQKCPKWIIYNDKRGEVRLRLISANGNMVAATNDGYLSKDAAKKGIEAIARAAQGADIVRNDDLW